jgi:hypothetical protein
VLPERAEDWEFLVSMCQGEDHFGFAVCRLRKLTQNHSDPGAGDAAAANGMISLSFGKLFEKVRNHRNSIPKF